MMPLPATPVIATLALVLSVAGWQTHQLALSEQRLAQARMDTAQLRQGLAEANLELVQKTKEADDAARRDFYSEEAALADDVAAVGGRINDLCLQHVTVERAHYRVQMPEPTGVVDGADTRAPDDRAAARVEFVAALTEDIRYCRTEVNRLTRLQAWVRAATVGVAP